MSHNFENVLEQVHQLTRWEQLELISTIAQLLGEDESDALPEQIIEENRRRLSAYDAGKTKGVPYKEAMRSVRAQMDERI